VQVDDKVIGTGKPGPVSLAILSQLMELERAYADYRFIF
jgi:hypothetical protein